MSSSSIAISTIRSSSSRDDDDVLDDRRFRGGRRRGRFAARRNGERPQAVAVARVPARTSRRDDVPRRPPSDAPPTRTARSVAPSSPATTTSRWSLAAREVRAVVVVDDDGENAYADDRWRGRPGGETRRSRPSSSWAAVMVASFPFLLPLAMMLRSVMVFGLGMLHCCYCNA
jgi:hypothetical protein